MLLWGLKVDSGDVFLCVAVSVGVVRSGPMWVGVGWVSHFGYSQTIENSTEQHRLNMFKI